MLTSKKDPLYAKLQTQAEGLLHTKELLEAKKERLGIIDSLEEIARLHRLLGNFDAVWATLDLAQRQRAFTLLINRIEVELVSPHWIRLSIDWLDAISPRVDIAYLWKGMPSRPGEFTEEEKEYITRYYPYSRRLDILKLVQICP